MLAREWCHDNIMRKLILTNYQCVYLTVLRQKDQWPVNDRFCISKPVCHDNIQHSFEIVHLKHGRL